MAVLIFIENTKRLLIGNQYGHDFQLISKLNIKR